jgi:phospholipase D/transphosphatidylase
MSFETDRPQKITAPLCEKDSGVQLSSSVFLHGKTAQYPISKSTFKPLVNGEKAFGEVYERISNAKKSIEITCWGFQPSMYFKRNGSAPPIGELLAKKAVENVKVKIMCWQTAAGIEKLGGEDNTPGRSMPAKLYEVNILPHLLEFLKSDAVSIQDFENFVARHEATFIGSSAQLGYTGKQAHYDWAWHQLSYFKMDDILYYEECKELLQLKCRIAPVLQKMVVKQEVDQAKEGFFQKTIPSSVKQAFEDLLKNGSNLAEASFEILANLYNHFDYPVLGKIYTDLSIKADDTFNIGSESYKRITKQVNNYLNKIFSPWVGMSDDDDPSQFVKNYMCCVSYAFLKKYRSEFPYTYHLFSTGIYEHERRGLKYKPSKDAKFKIPADIAESQCLNHDNTNSAIPTTTPIDVSPPEQKVVLDNIAVSDQRSKLIKKVISFKSRYISPGDIRAKEGRLKDGGISRLTKDVYAIFPSHHQKTVLIDYEAPKIAVGFVMGHNMLEAYWDTSKHGRRGKSPNTGAFFPIPRQDVSSIVSGEVLHDLNDNFIKSWEKIAPEDADFVAARKKISRKAYQPNAKLGTKLMAQIVRTQPEKEFDREEVMALYGQLVKRSCAYLYFENQYFRWPPLADALREWGKTLIECGRKEPLCVFAVTNTSNEGLGAGRINTDRMLARLGRRDVMPGVGKARLTQELKQQAEDLSDQLPNNWFGLREDTSQEARMRRQKQEAEQLRQELDRLSLEKDADLDKLRQILKKDLASEGLAVHVCRLVSTEVRERDADPKNGSNNAQEIYIHAKVAIADDAYLTLGSSNINTRSMQIDSELNIATEHGDTARKLRQELWGIHTGGNAGLNPAGHLNDPKEVYALFKKWDDAMKKNKESFRKSAPLTMSLLEFEMLDPSVTPYKYDLD